jgi:hypothetical protein
MPNMRRTVPLHDYQRMWNGHSVDKNLKDEWLQDLNDLKIFDLINICEGHRNEVGQRRNESPHIYLKIKEEIREKAYEYYRFSKNSDMLEKNMSKTFEDHLRFRCSLCFEKTITNTNRSSARIVFKLNSSPRLDFEKGGMDNWFTEAIKKIKKLDKKLWETI